MNAESDKIVITNEIDDEYYKYDLNRLRNENYDIKYRNKPVKVRQKYELQEQQELNDDDDDVDEDEDYNVGESEEESDTGGNDGDSETCENVDDVEDGEEIQEAAVENSVTLNHINGDSDDAKLVELLKQFDLEILHTTLKLSCITFRSLQYISQDDINAVIHHIGYRAEFREKLFYWRGENARQEAAELSITKSLPVRSSTENSLHNSYDGITNIINTVEPTTAVKSEPQVIVAETAKKSASPSIDNEIKLVPADFQDALLPIPRAVVNPQQKSKMYGYLPKGSLYMRSHKLNLQKLLRNCHIGRTIMLLYNKNGYLEIAQRAELVRIIIDDIIDRGERLCPKDYNSLLLDIIAMFPNEKSASDYYFIYRSKCNPLGRLHQRYCSETAKRRKLARKTSYKNSKENLPNKAKEEDAASNNSQDAVPQDDDLNATALKELFANSELTWAEVSSKWLQTLSLRQKEIKQNGFKRFMDSWPSLSDYRAAELFYIDFKHSYPGKENHLFAKWTEFSEQMLAHYERKIHADYIRKWIKYSKTDLATKDERDYAYAVGLIGLLPTTKNFKDHEGKLRIRATIKDSLDAFIMTLTTFEDFESQKKVYNLKFGPVNRTTHPFLVVISKTDLNISDIYVVLENRYYHSKSFLHALDLCFKMYHTCGLRYPTMCENVWTFIQRYFYNMSVPWEARNPNLSSLIGSVATPA